MKRIVATTLTLVMVLSAILVLLPRQEAESFVDLDCQSKRAQMQLCFSMYQYYTSIRDWENANYWYSRYLDCFEDWILTCGGG